jgi:hypothetical protein
MPSFATRVEKEQVAWRNRTSALPSERGEFRGKQYDHILPKRDWEHNLWPGIRSGGLFPLHEYLRLGKIKPHDHVHNLKSSWALCANLYFPFRNDPALLCDFLCATVSTEIIGVTSLARLLPFLNCSCGGDECVEQELAHAAG